MEALTTTSTSLFEIDYGKFKKQYKEHLEDLLGPLNVSHFAPEFKLKKIEKIEKMEKIGAHVFCPTLSSHMIICEVNSTDLTIYHSKNWTQGGNVIPAISPQEFREENYQVEYKGPGLGLAKSLKIATIVYEKKMASSAFDDASIAILCRTGIYVTPQTAYALFEKQHSLIA